MEIRKRYLPFSYISKSNGICFAAPAKNLAYDLYAGEGAHRSEAKKALIDHTSAGSFSPMSFFRII
jgi:hypothetical protein